MSEAQDSVLALLHLVSNPEKYESKVSDLLDLEKRAEAKSIAATEANKKAEVALAEANEKLHTVTSETKRVSDWDKELKVLKADLERREADLSNRLIAGEQRLREITERCDQRMTEMGQKEVNLKERESLIQRESDRLRDFNKSLVDKHEALRKIIG